MKLEKIYQKYSLDLLSSRHYLMDKMDHLEKNQIDCMSCSGICCTQSKNSMQLTLVEALTLYLNLKNKSLLNDQLLRKCQQTIHDARIDQKIYIKGKELRRNYTCPLFMHQSLGCPLDKDHKPYGCLGFNPLTPEVKNGENCQSDVVLLLKLDQAYTEKIGQANEAISNELNCENRKMTIPEAIVSFYELESKIC